MTTRSIRLPICCRFVTRLACRWSTTCIIIAALRDAMTVEQATAAAFATWARSAVSHIEPDRGLAGAWPRRHHDYIDLADFPDAWRQLPMTVEVEAKAKELAVLRLQGLDRFARQGYRPKFWPVRDAVNGPAPFPLSAE